MTGALSNLSEWLIGQGVTRVVVDGTSDYWKPVSYPLEASFETCW